MTTAIQEDKTVRELVLERPETRRVLERYGIDYCCGGGQRLGAAIEGASAERREVLDALERAVQSAAEPGASAEPDWLAMSLTDMADHIERLHHAYLRREMPRVEELLARVRRAHAQNHGPMLGELTLTFTGLRSEIEMHLMKEEQVLFPYLRALEASAMGRAELPTLHCVTVQNPVAQMRREHEQAGAALAAMREMTDGYRVPDDGCESFRALYEGLADMEADLHEHIHLENNILFPRAIELETAVRRE
jgi:regulator of cell morphogenesis and NO signaling